MPRDFSREQDLAQAAYTRILTTRQRFAEGEVDCWITENSAAAAALDAAMRALDVAAGTVVNAIVRTDRGEAVVMSTDFTGVWLTDFAGERYRRHRLECEPTGGVVVSVPFPVRQAFNSACEIMSRAYPEVPAHVA